MGQSRYGWDTEPRDSEPRHIGPARLTTPQRHAITSQRRVFPADDISIFLHTVF